MMNKTNKERYEEYDEMIWQKIVFDEDSKGYVVIHIAHGKHEREGNLKIAFRLAQSGFRVELLAVSPDNLSPDATVNDVIWEFKSSLGSYSSVQSRLRDGKEQSSSILLLLPIASFSAKCCVALFQQ